MENDRLQSTIAALEGRLKAVESTARSKQSSLEAEVEQLQASIRHYEGMVLEYKGQVESGRMEVEERSRELRHKDEEVERARQEGVLQVEKVRLSARRFGGSRTFHGFSLSEQAMLFTIVDKQFLLKLAEVIYVHVSIYSNGVISGHQRSFSASHRLRLHTNTKSLSWNPLKSSLR